MFLVWACYGLMVLDGTHGLGPFVWALCSKLVFIYAVSSNCLLSDSFDGSRPLHILDLLV